MKKKLLISFIALCIVFAILISAFIVWYVYTDRYEVTEKGRELSPDGRVEVILEQIGSPGFPFGPVKVRIRVKYTFREKDYTVIETSMYNDGGGLSDYNWSIEWSKETVTIILNHADLAEDTVFTVVIN